MLKKLKYTSNLARVIDVVDLSRSFMKSISSGIAHFFEGQINKQQGQISHIENYPKGWFEKYQYSPPFKTSNVHLPSSPTQVCAPIST